MQPLVIIDDLRDVDRLDFCDKWCSISDLLFFVFFSSSFFALALSWCENKLQLIKCCAVDQHDARVAKQTCISFTINRYAFGQLVRAYKFRASRSSVEHKFHFSLATNEKSAKIRKQTHNCGLCDTCLPTNVTACQAIYLCHGCIGRRVNYINSSDSHFWTKSIIFNF